MSTHDDPVFDALSQAHPPSGDEGCPSDNAIVGFVEGRLDAESRDGVVRHLRGCATCRALVASLAEDGEPAARPAVPAARRWAPLAAAAALLIAIGVAIALLAGGPPPDMDARLLAAARDLGAAHPHVFDDFRPLSPEERRGAVPSVERGGVTLHAPVQALLETQPSFAWAPVEGASEYTVTLFGSGKRLWERTTSETVLAWPQGVAALERGGTYMWRVRTEGPLGRDEGRRAFRIAGDDVLARFAAARTAIEREGDARLAGVLLAHWAIRAGLWVEAQRLLARHAERFPDDRVGRETAAYLARQARDGPAMRHVGPALLALLLALGSARAEDDPHAGASQGTPGTKARAFFDAWQAEDDTTMRALAEDVRVDPVLVAEALFLATADAAEGDAEACRQFVERAATSPQGRPLPALLERWEGFAQEDRARARRLQEAAAEAVRAYWRFRAGQEEAVAIARRHAADVEAARGRVPSGVLLSIKAAQCLASLHRGEEGKPLALSAVAEAKAMGWSRGRGMALQVLADCEHVLGRSEDVAAALIDAVAAFEEAQASVELAHTSGQLASVHVRARRMPEALAAARRAVAIAEDAGLPAYVANGLGTLAHAQALVGNVTDAIPLFERAIRLIEQSEAAASLPHLLTNAGQAYFTAGRIADAVRAYQRVLDSRMAVHDTRLVAIARTNLGSAYATLGLHEHARREIELGLGVVREGSLERAHLLRAGATLAGHAGRPEASLAQAGRARAAYATLGQHVRAASCALVEAAAAKSLGHLADSRALAEGAVAVFAKARAHAEGVRARAMLANLDATQGQYAKAIDGYRACLAALDDVADRGTLAAQIRGDLAEAMLRAGRFGEARIEARRAADLALHLTRTLDQRTALGVRRGSEAAVATGVRAAFLEGRDAASHAAPLIEAGRGLLLADHIVNRRSLLTAPVSTALREREALARLGLRNAQKAMIQAVLGPDVAPATVETARAELASARFAHERAVDELERAGRDAASLVPVQPLELADMQAMLGADTALVLYQWTAERLHALVVRRDRARLVDLGPSAELGDAASLHLELVAAPGGPEADSAARLYESLLRPLEPMLIGARDLLVSPHGVLTFVPFGALLRRDGKTSQRAVERWSIACIPGATVYRQLRRLHPKRAGQGLLALGDPVYPAKEKSGAAGSAPLPGPVLADATRGLTGLPRLVESGAEVRTIASYYPEADRTVLVREHATRSAFEDHVGRGRRACVHLACHAFVDRRHPRLGGLVLANGEVLTVDRLYRMRIAADVAVLSACDTGKGALARGEGIIGLTRGFFYAGVPRVLVTSWKISDASTRTLMESFHRNMRKHGMAPRDALRAAQLARLRAGGPEAHPYHWAAFAFWGLEG